MYISVYINLYIYNMRLYAYIYETISFIAPDTLNCDLPVGGSTSSVISRNSSSEHSQAPWNAKKHMQTPCQ